MVIMPQILETSVHAGLVLVPTSLIQLFLRDAKIAVHPMRSIVFSIERKISYGMWTLYEQSFFGQMG